MSFRARKKNVLCCACQITMYTVQCCLWWYWVYCFRARRCSTLLPNQQCQSTKRTQNTDEKKTTDGPNCFLDNGHHHLLFYQL